MENIQNLFQRLLQRKWFLPLAAVCTAILLVFLLSVRMVYNVPSSSTQPTLTKDTVKSPEVYLPKDSSPTLDPLKEILLTRAIEEQKRADAEYSTWQDEIHTKYQWRKHLPVYSQRYYAYFDFTVKTFIGRLYPRPNDSADALKAEIITLLKSKGIPVNDFPVEWKIFPQ